MRLSSLTAVLFIFSQSIILAEAKLDRFYPCVVSANSTTTLKAEGKFSTWPVTVHCDRDDLSWKLGEESGTLEITAAANAYSGVAWFRFTDSESSTDLIPLLITAAPVQNEIEPNQKISEATRIESLPVTVCGRLAKSGDLDSFLLTAKRDQNIVISLTGNQVLKSPMDAIIQIADTKGNVLEQADDVRGLDPTVLFNVPADSDYVVRVFAFPETPNSTIGYAGAATFLYTLNVVFATENADHFLPLKLDTDSAGTTKSPNQFNAYGWNDLTDSAIIVHPPTMVSPTTVNQNNRAGWQWIPGDAVRSEVWLESSKKEKKEVEDRQPKIPFSYSGHLTSAREVDSVRFSIKKDNKYRVESIAKEYGFPTDTLLSLVSVDDGTVLISNDDQARNVFDATIQYTAKQDREVDLRISDVVDSFGPAHAYSVFVTQPKPGFSLKAPAQRFSGESGKEIEVEISITRRNGFADSLQIVAENLPSGVSSEPVLSKPKGDSAKSVKLILKVQEAASTQSAFRITAQPIDAEGNLISAKQFATYPLRPTVQLDNFWLTISQPKPN